MTMLVFGRALPTVWVSIVCRRMGLGCWSVPGVLVGKCRLSVCV